MKMLLSLVITLALLSVQTVSAQETIDFDGCLGYKVEGTNYYNLVDPRCQTGSAKFSSTKGEDKRRELAAAAEAAAKK